MPTLRVFVAAPPDATRVEAWALFDAAGRVIERGLAVPAQMPRADRREAVVAADAVRMVSLALPPLPAARVRSAVAYAIEDRIATPARDVAIGIGPRRSDGRVLAIALARDFADALADAGFARAVAEPELAPAAPDAWRWCESASSAFVRTGDGAAFPASRVGEHELPAELSHALLQSAREGTAPREVVVDRETVPAMLEAWTRQTGVPFRPGSPWRWDDAEAQHFAGAIDLLQPTRESLAGAAPAPRFAGALVLLGAALLLHVLATLATFGWSEVTVANLARDLVPLAGSVGATTATPRTAAADIAVRHVEARHRAGLSAPADAMPILARASPALAALPRGALKTATFSGGAWTLELGAVDDATLAGLVERLRTAGLSPIYARTSAGVRTRIAP